jgi:MFS family permease
VVAGRLGDLHGRRRLLLVGILTFTAGSAFGACAGGLWALVLARGVQGSGAALMMALVVALASDAVPAARKGSAVGLLVNGARAVSGRRAD